MEKSRHVDSKKKLIVDMLKELTFKDRTVKYLLNYLVMNERLLKDVVFVDRCPELSTDKMEVPQRVFIEIKVDEVNSFSYKDYLTETSAADIGFNRLRSLINDGAFTVYLKIVVESSNFSIRFYELMENVGEDTKEVSSDISEMVDGVIEVMLNRHHLSTLMDKVNDSLDSGDIDSFKKYSSEYNEYLLSIDGKV